MATTSRAWRRCTTDSPDSETVPVVDVRAAEMLPRLASDLERRGVRLALARVGQVRRPAGQRRRLPPGWRSTRRLKVPRAAAMRSRWQVAQRTHPPSRTGIPRAPADNGDADNVQQHGHHRHVALLQPDLQVVRRSFRTRRVDECFTIKNRAAHAMTMVAQTGESTQIMRFYYEGSGLSGGRSPSMTSGARRR
jgi:MFS superfamily sulfate permease-like transporter